MGGQHRWAPAFLAACHHIYSITYYCIISYLANKICLLFVLSANIFRIQYPQFIW